MAAHACNSCTVGVREEGGLGLGGWQPDSEFGETLCHKELRESESDGRLVSPSDVLKSALVCAHARVHTYTRMCIQHTHSTTCVLPHNSGDL